MLIWIKLCFFLYQTCLELHLVPGLTLNLQHYFTLAQEDYSFKFRLISTYKGKKSVLVKLQWMFSISEEYSEPCQISKMLRFTKIINRWKPRTISQKSLSQMFYGVLNKLLYIISNITLEQKFLSIWKSMSNLLTVEIFSESLGSNGLNPALFTLNIQSIFKVNRAGFTPKQPPEVF